MGISRVKRLWVALVSAALLCWESAPTQIQAQSPVITYQGRLGENGQPANGNYDFRFSLFDAENAGSNVGQPILIDNQRVTGGSFTVLLDFGIEVFDGSRRWIDVGVRPGTSNGAYTSLLPRQPVTTTPYALRALTAASLQGTNLVKFDMLETSAVEQIQRPTVQLQNRLLAGNNSISGTNQFIGPLQATNRANSFVGRFTGAFFGDAGGLTNVPPSPLITAQIEAERSNRASAIAKALNDLLAGANAWSGTNAFIGPVRAFHPSNAVAGTFSGNFSGDGSGLTNLPSSGFQAALDKEKLAQAAALANSLVDLLAANNAWTGSNYFSGPAQFTNSGSSFAGQFTGDFVGDGTRITTIPATSIAGKINLVNLPELDASQVTSGAFL